MDRKHLPSSLLFVATFALLTAAGVSISPTAVSSTGGGVAGTPLSTGSGVAGTPLSTGGGVAGTPLSTGSGVASTSLSTGGGVASTSLSTGGGVASTSLSTGGGVAGTPLSTGGGVAGTPLSTGSGVASTSLSTGGGVARTSLSTGGGVASTSLSTSGGVAGTPLSTGGGVAGTSLSTGGGVVSTSLSTGSGVAGTPLSTGGGVAGTSLSTGGGVAGTSLSTGGSVVVRPSSTAVPSLSTRGVSSTGGGVASTPLSTGGGVAGTPLSTGGGVAGTSLSTGGGVAGTSLSTGGGVAGTPLSTGGSVVVRPSSTAVPSLSTRGVSSTGGGVASTPLSTGGGVAGTPLSTGGGVAGTSLSTGGGVAGTSLSTGGGVAGTPLSTAGSVVVRPSSTAVPSLSTRGVSSTGGGVAGTPLSTGGGVAGTPLNTVGSVVVTPSSTAVPSPSTRGVSSTGGGVAGTPLSTGSGVAGTPLSTGSGVAGTPLSTGGGVAGTSLSTGGGVAGTPLSTGGGVAGTSLSTGGGVAGTSLSSTGGSVVVRPSSTAVPSLSTRVASRTGGVAGTPNITVATPSTSVVSVNSIVSTSLSVYTMSNPTPTSTRKSSTGSSSNTLPKMTTYYEYNMAFTLTALEEKSNDVNETDVGVLSLLITKCHKSYTTADTIYFQIFQLYIQVEICRLYKPLSRECVVRVTKLKCGSITGNYSVTIGVDSSTSNIITNGSGFTTVKQEIQKGKLGVFMAKDSSFGRGKFKRDVGKQTPPKFQPEFEVIVIVTMGYTWKEFCSVAEQFKEEIAKRSYGLDGKKLKPNDIYIIDRKKNCDRPDDRDEEIEVKFVVIGEGQDKLTVTVGHDLIDLVESGLSRKLGNLFEGKIMKVEFSGPNAPTGKSGLSDIDKIWLAVGVTLGVIFILLFFYLCCCRQPEKKTDGEHGPDYFDMDKIDNEERETVLVNEGFDEHEGTHTPLSRIISTFKDVPENDNEPVTKSNNDEVSAQPTDDDAKLAPLGEGEDTDDELEMTVPDVAIETETPPETSPTIPPNPSHMAIKDLVKFLEESGDESQKSKEYENLDKTMTTPETYGINTQDRNRSDAIVPIPETRVKTPGQNDYINANFVKDHHGKENFIVTQHPLSNTMRDFWSMVWDKNVSVIVMVNSEEKDLENYHNYWLDHKNSLTIYGHMQVKTNHAESMSSFKLTKFVLQNSQEVDKTKTVNHFRFANWSNKGVPDAKEFAEFVRFIERVRLENPRPPIVVHCSEGQGYTGVVLATYIGLRVYNESDKKSTIDVFDCVEKMRKDRNGIVCSKELYNFVYKVLSVLTSEIDSSDSKL